MPFTSLSYIVVFILGAVLFYIAQKFLPVLLKKLKEYLIKKLSNE
ncbi:MAG: hypothetical protein BWY21_01311 [Parcubacteria group bacterium ADurb.Bin216]|jgi:hypothetical protein|nr:MAG: hypothetical protein BWY21_01311 [Parcubacteria group bacterium ADurb.Bin216]